MARHALRGIMTVVCVAGCGSTPKEPVRPDGGSLTSTDVSPNPPDALADDAGAQGQSDAGAQGQGDAALTTDDGRRDGETVDQSDGAEATDVQGLDVGEGACAEQFVSGSFSPAGETPGGFCLPLTRGITVNHIGCAPREVSVSAGGSVHVNVAGPMGMFSAAGPTMVAVALDGRGLPCASGAEACQFRTAGARCPATVVRSGDLNQVVEVALSGTCVLRQYDAAGNAVTELSLGALRMRGVLRLFSDVTSGDGGATVDCGAR